MIPVQEHLARILGQVRRLPPRVVPLAEARGAVLAAPVTSPVDLPNCTNSAMDGYAVRSADVAGATEERPVVLPVAGVIPAGDTRRLSLPPGSCWRIMTGAPVPDGADAIVQVELTDGGTETVRISAEVPPGRHVRDRGGDIREGEVVLEPGVRLGARQLALAAATGTGTLTVVPVPLVTVLSTGDELVEPGTIPGHGQVVDSNGLMLLTAAEEAGFRARRVGGVPDEPGAVLAAVTAQLDASDAVVTTGGVSAGAFDTVKEVLSRFGTMRFDRVAMQPGMPQGFGVLGERSVPVFTLPGNPVSSLVSFELFVAPALRLMAGRTAQEEAPVQAEAEHGWPSPPRKLQLARGLLGPARPDGTRTVRLVGGQASHILGGLAEADVLVEVPPEVTEVRAGDRLTCRPLRGATP